MRKPHRTLPARKCLISIPFFLGRVLRTLIAILFETRPNGTIQVSAKSLQKFKHRIRDLTGRSRGISLPHRLSQLRSDVRGWTGYFGLASQLKLFDRLDQWIRRRIRMCYWKRWRRPKRRREMLLQLGVPRRQAIRDPSCTQSQGPVAHGTVFNRNLAIASGVGMTVHVKMETRFRLRTFDPVHWDT